MTEKEYKKTTLRMDADKHQRLKLAAVHLKTSIHSIIMDCIDRFLYDFEKQQKTKREGGDYE